MTVSLDWLAQVNVVINTTVFQAPSFNNCMIMGVFPIADAPSTWSGARYHAYSNAAAVSTDFTPLYNAAISANAFAQAFKYQILIKAAQEFFSQEPTPELLYISCIDNTTTVNYVAEFTNITNAFNNFYAFYIADQVTATQLTTSTTGIYAAIASLTSAKNYKICFVDTSDLNITSGHFLYDATVGGIGSQRAMLFAHTLNPQTAVPSGAVSAPAVTLAAESMGAFFTNLFSAGIGLKPISGQGLQETASDTVITNSTLGDLGPNSRSGLLSVNANIYPAFGNSASGYVQYGFMASSTNSELLYLDQVIGADYIKLNVQADLATYILSQQPTGGVPYNDAGIQSLVNVFKKTLQNAVNQNVIQQFSNSNISFVPYAQVSNTDKTNRIYQGLSANLTYLSRIQRVAVNVALSL